MLYTHAFNFIRRLLLTRLADNASFSTQKPAPFEIRTVMIAPIKYLQKTPAIKTALLLFCLAILIYSNTLGHGFVYDDKAVLTKNSYVTHGMDGILDIFTTGSWSGFNPDRNLHIYRPLQLAVLAVQYEFFGLNPFLYHLVHILSYGLLCAFVYLLLSRMLKAVDSGRWIALIASVLFTLHPVHTEVVANIKGNGDLLAMLFGVITLLLIQRFGASGRWKFIGFSVFTFFIALLFKETVVTVVGVAGLMLYYFSDLKLKKICLVLLPLLLSVVAYLLARNLIFGGDANSLEGTTSNVSNVLLLVNGWSQEIGLRMYALGKNLQLLAFPHPLQMTYVFGSIPMVEVYEMESLFPATIYTILTLFFLFGLKKKSLLSFAVGAYLLTLFLFSNLLFSLPSMVSERWLLLPSLPFCLALAILFVTLSARYKWPAITALALLCFGYSGYTIQRNLAWESDLTLALTDVRTAPMDFNVVRLAGSTVFAEAKKNNMNPKMLRDSAHYMETILRITPHDAKRRNALGLVYEDLEDYDRAALAFGKAMQSETDFQDKARFSYAKNQVNAGNHLKALVELKNLEQDYPTLSYVKSLKGTALNALGREEEALESFRESLTLDPNDPRANRAMGQYYLDEAKANQLRIDDLKMSASHYEKWLKYFDGSLGEKLHAYNTLGQIYEAFDAHAKAANAFSLAAASPSIHSKARFSAAKNYNAAGDFASALTLWTELEKNHPKEIGVHIGKCISLIGSKADQVLVVERCQKLIKLLQTHTQELNPDQSSSLNKIAIALEKMNSHGLAALTFLAAAKGDSPIKGKAAFSSAKNLYAAGAYVQALTQWEAVDHDYPGIREVAFRKASTLVALGRRSEAKVIYEEIISRTVPGSPTANEDDYNRAMNQLNHLN